ncbi:MAG TPA: DUF4331 domain-containing protein [Gaiellaceae bacterium]|jgi:hypothetical protein|nr:DUF4331 domain-containing protein [Gaiellaceae bacterium]
MKANTGERSDRTMRKLAFVLLAAAASAALIVAFASRGGSPSAAEASSHREAPLISEDPSADNTDTYAFRSPDRPDTVTIISNYIPAEDPAAGPNWYTFSPSARYVLYADKNGDGKPDVTWRFRFKNRAPVAFLQNTQQEYTVTRVEGNSSRVVGNGLLTPPDNIGPRSTPNYHALAIAGVHDLNDGSKVFAGQRDDGFFGDIGAAFDLVAIRSGTGATGGGKDFFAGYAVHSIALQVPLSQLDNGGNHIVGVWSASERLVTKVTLAKWRGRKFLKKTPEWQQVSRLGEPLINELLIPTELKDKWNASTPDKDKQFAQYYSSPILAKLLNQLYPQFGPFQETNRTDLVSVLLTGLKEPNLNFTGDTQADEIRLNLAIAPTAAVGHGNRLGVLGGDLAGYPNGRRLEDDVIDISERAVGGVLIGHSLPLGDGVDANDVPYLATFPYQADPFSGFENTKGQQKP